MNLDYQRKKDGMYIISKAQMDEIAAMVLREYAPQVLAVPQPVDIDLLAEDNFNLTIINRHISKDNIILGLTAFADVRIHILDDDSQPCDCDIPEGTIVINSGLLEKEQEPRRRYTVAHELSHWILHRSYHSPYNQAYQFRTAGFIACKATYIERWRDTPNTVNNWEEWQADSLAASLLMPLDAFKSAMSCATRVNYIFEDFSRSYYGKLREIAEIFNVSKKAVEIRLRQLGYLKKVFID